MDFYLGEIMFFAGQYVPENFLPCDGRLLNVNEYQALYSLLGTTYGGTEPTTFALPDLRARIPVGNGQGGGLPNYAIGQKFGTPTVTLTVANVPSHSHTVVADKSNQTPGLDPTNALLTAASEAGSGVASAYTGTTTGSMTPLAGQAVSMAGGVSVPAPIDNCQPTLTLTPIMCVNGLYPTRP